MGNNPNDNGETEKMPIHRLMHVIDKLDNVELVVIMDGVEKLDHEKIITWDEFIAKGSTVDEAEINVRNDSIQPDDTSS